jgi:hypothetical protein
VAQRRETPDERRAREHAIERVLDLPLRDIMEAYAQIGRYLAAAGPGETRAERQIRERAEALTALTRAAEHLGLASAVAPTVRQYTEAREALGLQLSWQQIQRRWGMWREAAQALTGGRTTISREQEALRRSPARDLSGAPKYEAPLRGLRAWLTQAPAPRRLGTADYNAWVKRHNEGLPRDDRYLSATAALGVLVVAWDVALEVARPDSALDLATARAKHLQQLKATSGPLGLCNLSGVSLVRNETRAESQTKEHGDELPPYVAVVSGSRVWRWTDIEAHAADEENYRALYETGELQDQLMDYTDVAIVMQGTQTLKQSKARISNLLQTGSPNVPAPAGRVGQDAYWLRADFEQWCAEHPELIGASRKELIRARRAHGRSSGVAKDRNRRAKNPKKSR